MRRPHARPRLVGLEDRSVPADLTITSLSETPVANKLTLREAVATSNTNGENDNLFLDSMLLSGATAALTKGAITLGESGKTVALSFAGDVRPTLDGGGASRLFIIPAGATVSLGQLVLRNGKADNGGGISNAGALTLDGVTISGCEASTGDGGGLFSDDGSTVTIRNSTIEQNAAAVDGGGLAVGKADLATVSSSLVSGNSAGRFGGGVLGGNLTLTQATVFANEADNDGGGVWVNGDLVSVNSTLVGNRAAAEGAAGFAGGGLFVQGNRPGSKLANTLIAGNFVGKPTAQADGDIGGTAPAGANNNLVGDPASAGGLVNGTAGNLVGLNGGVRPLATVVAAAPAANGGTGPLTLALVGGGPAADAGDTASAKTPAGTALSNDARGFPFDRVAGPGVDIGAVEFQNVAPQVAGPTTPLVILEDSADGVTFAGAGKLITVSDPVNATPNYLVTLASSTGTVTLGSTTGLTALTGNGTGTVSFKSTDLAVVNAALTGTKYVAGANKNGAGGFTVTVNDGDATAPGGAKEGQGTVAVRITPVIDPPTVTSPATAKDTPVRVTLARNLVDGDEVTYFKVTNLANGTLSYVGPLSATPVAVANGAVLRFAGSFVNLTPDPETAFTFTPAAGFEGLASFDVQVATGIYGEDPAGGPPNPAPEFGGPVVTSRITVGNAVVLPAATFTAAALTASEGQAADVQVTVTLDRPAPQDLFIQVGFGGSATLNDPAANPAAFDYTVAGFAVAPFTVLIARGATVGTISLRLLDDALAEPTETAVLTLLPASAGVVIGANDTFTLSIADNDGPNADAVAPTAKLTTAPNVVGFGGTSYEFTVTYSDNGLVSRASLDGNDVRVTGPNGFSQLAAFVSADPAGNASAVTAKYKVTPPGGAFAAANVGTYTVSLEANQVFDTAANKAAAGPLGTFTVSATPPADTVAPTAKLATSPNVTAFGGTTYEFTVTYTDDVAVSRVSLDSNDVRVTGPNGFAGLATFVSATGTGDAAAVTATYKFTPPGGAFAVTNAGTYSLALVGAQVLDAAGNPAAAGTLGTFTVSGPRPLLVGAQQYAVGAGAGGDGAVRFYNADGTARLVDPLRPFGAFTGGVRTAAADFNADGVADIVVGTGPGRATRVVVLDGKSLAELFAVDPFEVAFTGGVFVAAGDLTGDGRADLVITPDEGGGPRVRVFGGDGFGQLADFFGIEDSKFRGGARAAVGDVDGDGRGDIVVAAGFGGGPRIATFSGAGLIPTGAPPKLFPDYFAFEQALRNGTFVAAGDIDGDGKAEVIAGGGPGGGPRVSAFRGADLATGLTARLADFFAGDVNNRGGVRLAVKNLDGDSKADILTGSGTGAGSRVTGYTGAAVAARPTDPAATGGFEAVPGFTGGVFVG